MLAWLRGAFERLHEVSATLKYVVFFLSLQMLFASPFFWEEPQPYGPVSPAMLRDLLWGYMDLFVTLASGIFAVSKSKRMVATAIPIALAAVGFTLAADWWQTTPLYLASNTAMIAFFGFTALVILWDIWRTHAVTLDTIVGAVCVFLLIGATWALVYTLTETLAPGSFQATSGNPAVAIQLQERHYPLYVYYSFMTLCTVGYGDIVPAKAGARMLAVWESIVGQFYIAVLVARLVALHVTRTTRTQS